MKNPGSVSEFTPRRNQELYSNFLELLRTPGPTPLREMFGMAARRPASRFWVSEERAAIVVSATLRGDHAATARMIPKRREMYAEITRRVITLMEREPDIPVSHAVERVVHQQAPEFYLTDESARLIIYRHRREMKKRAALNALGHLVKKND